ncbi:MAG: SoxY-related AACIE arm protein [Burkholderiaceae bacterium]|nr:SoxY-related AACIE arm protein [Burkholderiaceae bacterium]
MTLRMPGTVGRRDLLMAGAGALLAVRGAHALAPELEAAMRGFAGGAATREGRVKLEIEPLVENGNAVPITVSVASPMSASDHVTQIAVFNQKNPQHDVIVATLSPAMPQARLATRIRLATSQQLVAVARMNDGSLWTHTVEVIVTLAACLE